MPLPIAVTVSESFVSRRDDTVCVTFGTGGLPARTAIVMPLLVASSPVELVAIGTIEISPFAGALVGTAMTALNVVSFVAAPKATSVVVSIGVGKPAALVTWSPRRVIPVTSVAR